MQVKSWRECNLLHLVCVCLKGVCVWTPVHLFLFNVKHFEFFFLCCFANEFKYVELVLRRRWEVRRERVLSAAERLFEQL